MNKLKQIVDYIKADIEEYRVYKDDISYGVLIGYVESLSIINSTLDEDEWKLVGLDFDLDKEYLI